MSTDTIAQLVDDSESLAFADALAHRLELRRIPFSGTATAGALLAVAPASGQHVRDLALPVVTFNRSSAARAAMPGSVVVCGARDESDAPALAIADAIAQALELPRMAVHVLPAIHHHLYASAGMLPLQGPLSEDRACAAWMLQRLARAAGVDPLRDHESRVLWGEPTANLAQLARCEDAALVVVSGTTRSRLRRALSSSVIGPLSRRSDRPVLACPRDPAAAMRLRAALGWDASCRRPV